MSRVGTKETRTVSHRSLLDVSTVKRTLLCSSISSSRLSAPT